VCTLHRGITRGLLDAIAPETKLAGFVARDPDTAGCLIELRRARRRGSSARRIECRVGPIGVTGVLSATWVPDASVRRRARRRRAPDPATLREPGEDLADHVRLEERELFGLIEAALPAARLAAVAAALEHAEP
jgi:hypothetical protein